MAEHKYLYTVRQSFGEAPHLDCFYKMQVPKGITSSHIAEMNALMQTEDNKFPFLEEEIRSDSHTYNNMKLRIQFNGDMFQRICLVKSDSEIDADTFESLLTMYHNDNTLVSYLNKSAV